MTPFRHRSATYQGKSARRQRSWGEGALSLFFLSLDAREQLDQFVEFLALLVRIAAFDGGLHAGPRVISEHHIFDALECSLDRLDLLQNLEIGRAHV